MNRGNPRRPISLTVLGWALVLGAVLGPVFFVIASQFPPLQKALQQVYIYAGLFYLDSVVSFMSGIGILRGREWARVLYFVYATVRSLLRATEFSAIVVLGVVSGILSLAYALFRAPASDYFFSVSATRDPVLRFF